MLVPRFYHLNSKKISLNIRIMRSSVAPRKFPSWSGAKRNGTELGKLSEMEKIGENEGAATSKREE